MGRYDDILLKFNKKGQRVLVPTIYPTIPISDNDQFVYPQDGDRLDNLSMTFYKTPSLWWYIAKANNLTDINVPTGTTLRIPISVDYAKGK